MTTNLPLDGALLAEARPFFERRKRLFWILGGSCTGKSAVSAWISRTSGIETLDMDNLIFGRFMASYTAERHPAASRWFGAEDSLDWALSLTWDQFNALNRASNAEFLDLLSGEPVLQPEGKALIIDGGFTHPSVLVQVAPRSNIVGLAASDEIRFRTWETAKERMAMKQWIHDLPDGQAKWQKFLYFDKMIAETIVAESEAAGIPVVRRRDIDSVEVVAGAVLSTLSHQLSAQD